MNLARILVPTHSNNYNQPVKRVRIRKPFSIFISFLPHPTYLFILTSICITLFCRLLNCVVIQVEIKSFDGDNINDGCPIKKTSDYFYRGL